MHKLAAPLAQYFVVAANHVALHLLRHTLRHAH